MTDLRAAAQQALEALEHDNPAGRTATITALRAALAEPEPPPEAQTEAEKMAYCAGWWDAMAKARKAEPVQQGCDHCNHPLYAAVKCRVCGRVTEPVQEPIKWTLDGDKQCGYNNWLGETPFGRILITWKGWKANPDACVDEFPGGFQAYGEPEEVKAACAAEFASRHGNAPPQRKPLTEEEIKRLVSNDMVQFARAIERAHGITP